MRRLDDVEELLRRPFGEYQKLWVLANTGPVGNGIGEGLADLKEGKVRPWADIKAELALDVDH